jgi:hypothetical protein
MGNPDRGIEPSREPTKHKRRENADMSAEDPVIPVFIPALVALLLRAEQLKGSPLTRDEVVSIRDNAVCMTVRASVKAAMEEKRGYRDIDPERCWEEWLQFRAQMSAGDAGT